MTIAIPPRTWVTVPLPPRSSTVGLADVDKHIAGAVCPDDGLIYFIGGDYRGGSYLQDMPVLDLAARMTSTNPQTGWAEAYPRCGPTDQPRPKGPDYVGWTWDARRKVFWMIPGEMQPHGVAICPGEVPNDYSTNGHLKFRHIMTFDPRARRFADRGPMSATPDIGTGRDTWHAVYDEATDTITHALQGYWMGMYAPASGTWPRYHFDTPGASPAIHKSGWAADFPGRLIYMADPYAMRLRAWHLDQRVLLNVAALPGPPISTQPTDVVGDKGYIAWDPLNRVLIYYGYLRQGVWAYHPDTRAWEALPSVDDRGRAVHWNGACYHAAHNLLVCWGEPDSLTLFRYAGGNGPPGGTMKTATYSITLADEAFPAGTPVPTALVAVASGPVTRESAPVPYDPALTVATATIAFDETTEAGSYQGVVRLMAGAAILKTVGPVGFNIQAGPTTVTYRSLGAFTVTVG